MRARGWDFNLLTFDIIDRLRSRLRFRFDKLRLDFDKLSLRCFQQVTNLLYYWSHQPSTVMPAVSAGTPGGVS